MDFDILIDKIFDLLNKIIKKYTIYKYSFDSLNLIEETEEEYIHLNKHNVNKQEFFKNELNFLIINIKNKLKYDKVKLYFYEWPEYNYFYYELYININNNDITFILNSKNETYAEITYEQINCKLIIYPIVDNQQQYTIEKYEYDKCIFDENFYFYGSRKDCLRQIYEIICSIC